MPTLRVLVVDDDRLSRQRLKRLLAMDPAIDLVAECSAASEALYCLEETVVDVVFLDVELPGMDGFSLLKAARPDRMWSVIFVTAHDHFALQAFEAQALDYLLKPYEDERLREAVRRAKARLEKVRSSLEHVNIDELESVPPMAHYRDRLAVRVGDGLVLLHVDQVDWIEAADNYVNLHCGSETHTVRETMNALQQTLDPRKFVRIHRSAIVNFDRVKALQPWFGGEYRVVLSTGNILTLSRSYRKNLEERIMNR